MPTRWWSSSPICSLWTTSKHRCRSRRKSFFRRLFSFAPPLRISRAEGRRPRRLPVSRRRFAPSASGTGSLFAAAWRRASPLLQGFPWFCAAFLQEAIHGYQFLRISQIFFRKTTEGEEFSKKNIESDDAQVLMSIHSLSFPQGRFPASGFPKIWEFFSFSLYRNELSVVENSVENVNNSW